MNRILVLALGLLFVPAFASAQVEIGLDGGFTYESIDDVDNSFTTFDVPKGALRIGFPGGERIIVETLFEFDWSKFGDFSLTSLHLIPGVNFLLNDQFYVRGEAGLSYDRESNGDTDSETQYVFGAGAGIRSPITDSVLLRVEGGLDRWMEKKDGDIVTIPASWEFRAVVGISAVVN